MTISHWVKPIPRLNALRAADTHLILHPTDLTQVSEKAFAVAVSLAKAHGAALIIAYALPPRRVVIESSEPVSNSIVRCAEDRHADMIVMGTNGKVGVKRWFAGSHAVRVIARADCPVVVVREGATGY